MEKRTSIPANALIWFGAGVSLAEILTGTFFAPLGFRDGGIAIIAGHVIGCFLLFLAGLIGARTRRSAMETVKMAFGARGGVLFAVLNVMQLVGWTSIMIYDGALAANSVMDAGHWIWCLVIGALIIIWVRIGILRIERECCCDDRTLPPHGAPLLGHYGREWCSRGQRRRRGDELCDGA